LRGPCDGRHRIVRGIHGFARYPRKSGKFIATIPMGRLSDPTDIAKACLYLASDDATFITGVVLEVDGGRTI
jgi:3-oxoacyl-[acyl-carrier protein] reductase